MPVDHNQGLAQVGAPWPSNVIALRLWINSFPRTGIKFEFEQAAIELSGGKLDAAF